MTKLRRTAHLLLTSRLNDREIAHAVEISRGTVSRYRRIITDKEYCWDELQHLDADALDARFNKAARRLTRRRIPDFSVVHEEMRKAGVTLTLLWEEYRAPEPDNALSYSQFTEHYRAYLKRIDRVMRQPHAPGERCFVDFSGRRPGYTCPDTGAWISVDLFVGALGASNLIFATCVQNQSLPNWISAHVDMFEFYGCVPKILVPDNLRSAISKSGPDFVTNPTYQEMAEYYGTTVLPCRVYRPRDKAKVEGSVLIVQRWILARLRNLSHFSLKELNDSVAALVTELNARPFKRLPGNRRDRFEEIERLAMLPLPQYRYEFGEWTGLMRVDNGYHVLVNQHWYSVPNHLVGEQVTVRMTAQTVEVFHKFKRITSHVRNDKPGELSTKPEHQPDAHRSYAQRTPELCIAWGETMGASIAVFVRAQFERAAPALGFPACESLRKLIKQYGIDDVEAAAMRAVEIQSLTLKSIRSLLSTQKHRREREETPNGHLPSHQNVRGSDYYAPAVEDASC